MNAFSNISVINVPNKSLRRFSGRSKPLLRLVCFPWCGAGASVYRKLAQYIPDHIEVLAIQLPGREDKFSENKLLRMASVVDYISPDIIEIFDRPLIFFGHSMGSLIAYEIAQSIRLKIGLEPLGIIFSGRNAPSHISNNSQNTSWHRTDDAVFMEHIKQLGGTPSAILEDQSMVNLYKPLLRADYEVLETYSYQPHVLFSCPVVACAGKQDLQVNEIGMSAWKTLTSGESQLHWLDDGHFYMTRNPLETASHINNWIKWFQEVASEK